VSGPEAGRAPETAEGKFADAFPGRGGDAGRGGAPSYLVFAYGAQAWGFARALPPRPTAGTKPRHGVAVATVCTVCLCSGKGGRAGGLE